ncbi:MAG: hypothetical protein E7258_04780 [Lachnospiraceae bacterium]|nr:hypothetical protein [Lachnospiraceae bacterium]
MLLNKLGDNPIDYLPFVMVLTICVISAYIIYKLIKKHISKKEHIIQLLEEQNNLLKSKE